jgi:hypothetical protein
MSKTHSSEVPPKSIDIPSQAAVPHHGQTEGRDGDPVAERIVKFVLSRYRLGVNETGEPFAVPKVGANVGVLFRESRRFRQALLADYRTHSRQLVQPAVMKTAIECLAGEAAKHPKVTLPIRVARHQGEVIIDMADESGRAIVVTPGVGWRIVDRSPVTFRRSALMAPVVAPCHGASLEDLRQELRVPTEQWRTVAGWMLFTFVTGVPRPLLVLEGSKGSGKSVLMDRIMDLVDPTSLPRRSEPSSIREWQVAAWAGHVYPLDNITEFPKWFGEALCRASTGDAGVTREMFSDKELSLTKIQSPVIITTTGLRGVKPDLRERMLRIEFQRVPDDRREAEEKLNQAWSQFVSRGLGALLSSLSTVLATLPDVEPKKLPRMADFGRCLAAADAAGVLHGALDSYVASLVEAEMTDLQLDQFVSQVAELVCEQSGWRGTATQLIEAVRGRQAKSLDRHLPDPKSVRRRLEGCLDGLRALGIGVQFKKGQDRRIVFTYDPTHGVAPADRGASGGAPDGSNPPSDADERWDSGNECR